MTGGPCPPAPGDAVLRRCWGGNTKRQGPKRTDSRGSETGKDQSWGGTRTTSQGPRGITGLWVPTPTFTPHQLSPDPSGPPSPGHRKRHPSPRCTCLKITCPERESESSGFLWSPPGCHRHDCPPLPLAPVGRSVRPSYQPGHREVPEEPGHKNPTTVGTPLRPSPVSLFPVCTPQQRPGQERARHRRPLANMWDERKADGK